MFRVKNPEGIIQRLLFSIGFNGIRAILSFVIGLIIAKKLGPEEFGNFYFLLGTFIAFRQLIDLGTSTAFFTFISRNNRSKYFYFLYFGWQIFQFLAVIILIGLVIPN